MYNIQRRSHTKDRNKSMALNPIHKVRVAVSQGPRDEQKQYSPRERERDGEREREEEEEEKYNGRDLQTVRHSSKDGKGKQNGIIKTQKVIENRNEVKSL